MEITFKLDTSNTDDVRRLVEMLRGLDDNSAPPAKMPGSTGTAKPDVANFERYAKKNPSESKWVDRGPLALFALGWKCKGPITRSARNKKSWTGYSFWNPADRFEHTIIDVRRLAPWEIEIIERAVANGGTPLPADVGTGAPSKQEGQGVGRRAVICIRCDKEVGTVPANRYASAISREVKRDHYAESGHEEYQLGPPR